MHRDDPIPALKRQLGAELARRVRDWNADDIAFMIGTDRWRIADLRRGKLDRFSLETLIRYLARLRHHVDVAVTPVRINKSIGRRATIRLLGEFEFKSRAISSDPTPPMTNDSAARP